MLAEHTGADTAYVEAAHLWFTEEEAIRQPDLVNAGSNFLVQRKNIATFGAYRKNESASKIPIFRSINPGFQIFYIATQTSKILTEHKTLAARRADIVVKIRKNKAVAKR